MVLILGLLALVLSGCSTVDKISIARGSKLPEEAKGFAQVLTDEPILVGIIGSDVVAKKNVCSYAIVNLEDLAQLVRNTEELLKLKAATRGATAPPR